MAKTGNETDNEDGIFINSSFVAVIDGATSKVTQKLDGETPGRTGMHAIKSALQHIDPRATAHQAVEILTDAVQEIYRAHGMIEKVIHDPKYRISSSVMILSTHRNEIWSVGDCQYLLDGHYYFQSVKAVDTCLAEVRSLFLTIELLAGKNLSDLQAFDTGREFIRPLLERQASLQNNPSADEFTYCVIDGFSVPSQGIHVHHLSGETKEIVLATDGYPQVAMSLDESESNLHRIIEQDPMMFRQVKSTKGRQRGFVSFDDRSYVRLMRVE